MTESGERVEFELNLDSRDLEQFELLARLTPAERALAMMRPGLCNGRYTRCLCATVA